MQLSLGIGFENVKVPTET